MISGISNSFLYSPSFTSRKKEVRKADDLQRKARQVFPMISPTYADKFYLTTKYGKLRTFEILNNAHKKVKENRAIANVSNPHISYTPHLNLLKNSKLGNCFEASLATIATLFANGFDDVKRVGLVLNVTFTDKDTNNLVYSAFKPIDHTFVMAKMNQDDKEFVVIDPWLGISDDKDMALAKYKEVYFKDEVTKHNNETISRVLKNNYNRERFRNKKLKIDTKLNFEILEEFSEDDKKLLASYARMAYDGILLDD